MSEMKILDYRNGKYQGATQKIIRHGIGLFLDQNFLLAIANWQNNLISGPFLIIYPQDIVFYGQMIEGNPHQLCVFQMPNKVGIHLVFANGKPKKSVAISLDKSGIVLNAELIPNQNNYDVKLIEEKLFQNQDQRNNLISDILGFKMKRSWISSLKFYEDELYGKNEGILDINLITKSRNRQVCVGFRKTETIGACFSQNSEVLNVGHYSKDYTFKDLGKRYIQTSQGIEIEEAIFAQNSKPFPKYNNRETKRPPQIVKVFQLYLKKSIDFINQFVDLKNVYNLLKIVLKVDNYLIETTAQKYAQAQLQKNGHPTHQFQSKELNSSVLKPNVYDIQFMKKNIHQAANRSKSRGYNNRQSPRQTYKRQSPRGKDPYIYTPIKDKYPLQNSRTRTPLEFSFVNQGSPYKKINYQQRMIKKNQYNPSYTNPQVDISKKSKSPNRYKYFKDARDVDQLVFQYKALNKEVHTHSRSIRKNNNDKSLKKYKYIENS